jgi:hypothetical protein
LLRAQATAFMGVAKDDTRSAEDVISTPLPGETLAMFFARSSDYFASRTLTCANEALEEHWTGKAIGRSEQRGKELRRVAFGWAEERYGTLVRIHSWSVYQFGPNSGVQADSRRSGEDPRRSGPGRRRYQKRRGCWWGWSSGTEPESAVVQRVLYMLNTTSTSIFR